MTIQEKFPSIKPSLNLDFANTKTLDPRVTFSRASTATYYDGKTVAKAEENLLIRSQEFDNAAWNKAASSVSANVATAPDGTTTADKIVESSTNETHAIFQSVGNVGSVYTVSVYVKADGRNFVLIGNTQHAVSVDLTTGVVSVATGSFISTGSQDAGNGWWRVYFTVTVALQQWIIYTSIDGVFANRTYLGDGTSGVLVWGAQLEQRSSVTAYTATTTQPITNYVPVLRTAAANVARFDHNPVTGESLGLLIEEQRTNLLTYSEQFDNAAWTKTDAAITANTVVAPNNTLSGAKFIPNSGLIGDLRRNIAYIAGTIYSVSLFFKADGLDQIKLVLGFGWVNTAADRTLTVSLVNKSVVSAGNAWVSGSVFFVDYGNGWYRLQATTTSATTTTTSYISLQNAALGDGFSGVYIWGAQLEVGAFPTSYIKTEASQVTRSADAASMTGTNFSSWYRQDEGSVFVEWETKNFSTAFNITLEASSSNFIRPVENTNSWNITYGGTRQAGIAGTFATSGVFAKSAMAYKFNDVAFVLNGGTAVTDTSANIPDASSLNMSGGSAVGRLNGHIRKIAYYPQRLTNTQLQSLTS